MHVRLSSFTTNIQLHQLVKTHDGAPVEAPTAIETAAALSEYAQHVAGNGTTHADPFVATNGAQVVADTRHRKRRTVIVSVDGTLDAREHWMPRVVVALRELADRPEALTDDEAFTASNGCEVKLLFSSWSEQKHYSGVPA